VREREWEAAHTFWLWPDVSPSMVFHSHLAHTTKRDRAVVLTLAFAELLVRAGERIALMGVTPPLASRKASARIAEALATHETDPALQASLPPPARLSRFRPHCCSAISSTAGGHHRAHQRAGRRRRQWPSDPDPRPGRRDAGLPGRMEFRGPEGGERWIADRVETLRPAYRRSSRRIGTPSHKRRAGSAGRSWCIIPTVPAAEPLLALTMRLQGLAGDYRWKSEDRSAEGPR
jgi:uncharacterized protein (DUF58 family)